MPEPRIECLDTNVLISDPDGLRAFKENAVVILPTVRRQLDKLKGEDSARGFYAREVLRELSEMDERGQIRYIIPDKKNRKGLISFEGAPSPFICVVGSGIVHGRRYDSSDDQIIAEVRG